MDLSTDLQAGTVHITLDSILDQITEITTAIPAVMTTDRATTETTIETEDTSKIQDVTKETRTTKTGMISNQDRNRFDNRRRPNKYQHYRNQPKAQIIFEYTDQNLLEMMQMVRSFINFMKANPTTRDQFKTNKLAMRKEYNNEVNKSDIHSSNLDQVQQLINEDTDLVFDALVAADYIDEIECTDGNKHQNA